MDNVIRSFTQMLKEENRETERSYIIGSNISNMSIIQKDFIRSRRAYEMHKKKMMLAKRGMETYRVQFDDICYNMTSLVSKSNVDTNTPSSV
jgi:hypothetical protein